MPPRLFFELRVFRGDREVKHGPRLREALDWEDVEGTRRLLAHHVLGAAERDGSDRAHAHMYHLDIHTVDLRGQAVRQLHSQFALPFEGGAEWL